MPRAFGLAAALLVLAACNANAGGSMPPAPSGASAASRGARVVCLVQGIVAFFFNTIILSLTINIGAGLI